MGQSITRDERRALCYALVNPLRIAVPDNEKKLSKRQYGNLSIPHNATYGWKLFRAAQCMAERGFLRLIEQRSIDKGTLYVFALTKTGSELFPDHPVPGYVNYTG